MSSSVSFNFNTNLAKEIIKQAGKQAIDVCLLDLQNKSVQATPVDTGDLRASIVPNTEFEETPNTVSKTFGTDLPYALKQHEDLTLNHPKGGGAKYLEKPFDENKYTYETKIKETVKNALRNQP